MKSCENCKHFATDESRPEGGRCTFLAEDFGTYKEDGCTDFERRKGNGK